MTNPINPELREQISNIIEFKQMPPGSIQTRDLRGDHNMSSSELGYKIRLIMDLVAKAITEAEQGAREDQIMQDFLSLTVDYGGDIDEVHLIGWRDDRLAELTTKKEAQ